MFEAAIPICGGGDPNLAHRLNKTRIWAFHSRNDPMVPVNASREMFEAIVKARGIPNHRVKRKLVGRGTEREAIEAFVTPTAGEEWAELRYTEYVSGGHDAWQRATSDERLARWALATQYGCRQLSWDVGRELFGSAVT